MSCVDARIASTSVEVLASTLAILPLEREFVKTSTTAPTVAVSCYWGVHAKYWSMVLDCHLHCRDTQRVRVHRCLQLRDPSLVAPGGEGHSSPWQLGKTFRYDPTSHELRTHATVLEGLLVCGLLCSLLCGASSPRPPLIVEPRVLCSAHCASLCSFSASSQCCCPTRTHRAGQAGRDALSLL